MCFVEVPDAQSNLLMIFCKHIVYVLYIVFPIYHVVFVNTQVNEIHFPPKLETMDELHIILFLRV